MAIKHVAAHHAKPVHHTTHSAAAGKVTKLTDAQLKKVIPNIIDAWGPVQGKESSSKELKNLSNVSPDVNMALVRARKDLEKTPIADDGTHETFNFDNYYELHQGKNGPLLGYAVLGSNGSDPEYVTGMVSVVSPKGKLLYSDSDVNAD
jgi:hypothetical protein